MISVAAGILGIFSWTYSQFSAVNTHAAQTDVTVAGIGQRTEDVDARLTRIEDKLDAALQKK